MWRNIKFYFISLLIIGLAGVALYYRYVPQRQLVQRTFDVPAVLRSIQHLKQLVTVRYNIQKIIGLEESKTLGTEKVLIMVQAKVLGGIDLGQLTNQDVTMTGDALTIRLPPPQILDVSLDDKETRVWDHSISWWAVWASPDPDLEQNARRSALEAVQQAALQMGILSNAQENAEISIREFLNTVGLTNVNFTAARAR